MLRPVLVAMIAALGARAAVSVGMAASTSSAMNRPTAVCQHGGYADLFAQDGDGTFDNPSTTFAKQRDCMRWIRAGGAVGELRPELIPDHGIFQFWLTVSGAAPIGTMRACGNLDLPLLVSYTFSGRFGSGCLDPPVYETPFQILSAPCTVGEPIEVTVLMATASGGVVGRTVEGVCE
jgi:hypothetical protein